MQKHNVLSIIVLLLAFVAYQSVFVVHQAQQAMVLQFGDPVAQYTLPGLKFKTPFVQHVRLFEKRVLDLDPPPEEVILSDQKRIVVDVFARYRITNVLKFYRTLGTEDQASLRLNYIANSTTRSVLGNATLTDLLSDKRASLMASVKNSVNAAVSYMGIEMVDVRIGRADLPAQTSQAIFQRMRTEREREAAEFRAEGQELAQAIRSKADRDRTVLLAEADRQSQVLRGDGDRAAIEIYAKAYQKDPQFYSFYRSLEAYRKGLGDGTATMVLTPDSEFFRTFTQGPR